MTPTQKVEVSLRIQCLILVLVGVLLYANSIADDWAFDDDIVYTANPHVLRGLAGIPALLTQDAYQHLYDAASADEAELAGGRYRPLSMITFAIESDVFGIHPHLAHAVNVGLFLACLVAMIVFLRRFLPDRSGWAFLATLLFALHPIHTEVVANVKSRDEILSLGLILLTLDSALRFVDQRSVRWLLMIGVYSFLALLAKEYAVTLVGLLPLALLLRGKRGSAGGLRILAPFAISLVAYLFLRLRAVGLHSAESGDILNNPYLLATTAEALATKIFVLLKYLGLLFWPHPLSSDYSFNQIPYRSFSDPSVILSSAIHVGLVVLAVVLILRRHWIGFAFAFYLAHLSLVSNLAIDIGATMGERLIYHSSLGFSMVLAAGFLRCIQPLQSLARSRAYVGFAALLLAVAAPVIIGRNADWKNDQTLFIQDVRTVPNSVVANTNAGISYLALSDSAQEDRELLIHEAISHLRKAVTIYPDMVVAYLSLGAAYGRLGDLVEMEAALKEVRRREPAHPLLVVYEKGLAQRLAKEGILAAQQSRYLEARDQLLRAVYYQTDQPIYWFALGQAHAQLGDRPAAEAAWRRALELDPSFSRARDALEGGE